jgi:hypothetical protein
VLRADSRRSIRWILQVSVYLRTYQYVGCKARLGTCRLKKRLIENGPFKDALYEPFSGQLSIDP